jgi:hypothetical protein
MSFDAYYGWDLNYANCCREERHVDLFTFFYEKLCVKSMTMKCKCIRFEHEA